MRWGGVGWGGLGWIGVDWIEVCCGDEGGRERGGGWMGL